MKLDVLVNPKFLVFYLLGFFIPLVFAQSSGVERAKGIYLVESVIWNPSGPIFKKEWGDPKTSQVIRIEYLKVTSGRPLIGRIRLILATNGCWVVERSDGDYMPLTCQDNGLGKKPLLVTDGADTWEISVISIYNLPQQRPGIAMESEPSIDLVINRVK